MISPDLLFRALHLQHLGISHAAFLIGNCPGLRETAHPRSRLPRGGLQPVTDRWGYKDPTLCLNSGLLYGAVSALDILVGWLSLRCVCSGQLPFWPILPSSLPYSCITCDHATINLHAAPHFRVCFRGPNNRQSCALSNIAPN